MNYFNDRYDAGQQLAEKLFSLEDKKNTVVLALPRGGVPVAYEIATILHLPMDVFIVRKLGVPGHEELAMGAMAEKNILYLNHYLISELGITEKQIQLVLKQEKKEFERRLHYYRYNKAALDLTRKTVILVDDGIATGATIKAAVGALKMTNLKKLILAIPVASKEGLEVLNYVTDEVICLITPEPFYGVGRWYNQFAQVTDEEVFTLLHEK